MRHFEEDEEARIGNKRVYINYSRSRSIEGRDFEPIVSNGNVGSTNGGVNGWAAVGGADGNGHMQVGDAKLRIYWLLLAGVVVSKR